jgi:CHAT domain-containing protein
MTVGSLGSAAILSSIERLRDFEPTPAWGCFIRESVVPAIEPSERATFLTGLKDESERFLTVDPRIALRLAEALITAADQLDRPDHRAFGLMAKGDALRALGRYEESRASFADAQRDFLTRHNRVGWARAQTGLLFVSRFLDTGDSALADTDRARDILVSHDQWLRAAGLCLNAGLVCAELGRFDTAYHYNEQALEFYARATQADPALHQTVEIRSAKARSNQALILTRQGELRAALALLQQARDVFVSHGETMLVYGQDKHIADVIAGQGYYTRALRAYGEAFQAYREAGLVADAAIVGLSQIECYLRLNYFDEALALANQSIDWLETAGSPAEAAKARLYAALARLARGDDERALDLLTQAADAFERGGQTGYFGIALLHQASLLLARNDLANAIRAAWRAEGIFSDRHMLVFASQAQLVRGRALLASGRPADATALASAALALARDRDLAWLAHEAHHVRASAARQRGAVDLAMSEYRAAIASIERVQGALAPELRTRFLGDKRAVFHEAIELCLDQGRSDLAFGYLERAKSRALVDYLANHAEVRLRSASRVSDKTRDELARLREEHNGLWQRLHRTGLSHGVTNGAGDVGEPSAAEIAGLRAAIQEREQQIAAILDQLALERAHLEVPDLAGQSTAARQMPNPPLLDPATVLLEYYFGEDTGVVFIAANGRLRAVPLVARPRDIANLVSQWQLNLAATARAILNREPLARVTRIARGILEALGKALLQPVEAVLDAGERLAIVPYGVTHAVPFPALILRSRYLVEMTNVTMCPSSSLLERCVTQPRRDHTRALVIGHGNGGHLPGVIAEAKAVAELIPGECYLDELATRQAVIDAAPRYGVIHLAAHGEARPDNPTFAHLQLADGQLSVADVLELDLRGALVTLSACESGRAIVVGGDELVGLNRGFLYAGAATLVQSLWRIEDQATAELMTSFYRELVKGSPAGAALREAQRAYLDERNVHPYFWAAFQVVGAGD